MDKPLSMPLKEYLINALSVRSNTPVNVIEAVVNHQFEEANKALKNNKSVEISGFGKFIYKIPAATKRLTKEHFKAKYFTNLLNKAETEQKKQSYTNKLNNTLKEIEILETKLYGNKTDIGGMEKQINSKEGIERDNREYISGKDSNL